MTRLVYITASTFPNQKASSVQVLQMCAAFATAGAAVKLVARDPGPGRLSADQLCQHYDVPPIFAIEQHPLPRGPRSTDRFQAQAVWRERGHPWLCYARGREVTAPLLALLLGAPALVEVHGRPASLRERVLLRLIQAHRRGRLIALTDALHTVYAGELGFRRERFVIAPDGVDLRRFTPPLGKAAARAACGLPADVRWVIYVGGLYPGRGLETLFAAMVGQPAQLLVVGGRNEAEIGHWQATAQAAGLAAARFTGYQPPAAIPVYLQAAEVLAMPYGASTLTPGGEDTTAWMSPLKLFEYMAAARPLVASDLPALRAVLAHERNALLVPPDDPAPLAAAIGRLLADPALAERLATTARADVQSHTWEARARHILRHVPDA